MVAEQRGPGASLASLVRTCYFFILLNAVQEVNIVIVLGNGDPVD